MALFDAWYTAIIVLDANVLLNLHERSAVSSEEQLDILENLSEKIYIPRQFYDEYQKHVPYIANRVSKQYRVVDNNLQSYRDNTTKNLIRLPNQNGFVIASIISEFDELFQKAIEAVSSGREQHIARLFEDDIDDRIARLIDGKIGDPFPQSRLDSIYIEGRFRYNNKIPPGFKDYYRKGEPDCYGDLVGWKQIIEFADEDIIKRPVIMVTDDSSGEDWFYKSNGEPRGPRHELVQELRDQAGVDFYLYTSDQFMLFARMYLKSRAMAESAGEYFRRLTPTLLPGFGKIAATGSLSAFTARVSIFNDYRHSLNSLPELTAGVSSKGLLDSISAMTGFSESYKHSFSSMARRTARMNSKGLLDSISEITAFSEIYKPPLATMAALTAGMNSKGLLDSISEITAFSEIYKPPLATMAALTAGMSSKGLLDSISGSNAFSEIYKPPLATMAALTAGMSSKGLFNSVSGISAFANRIQPVLEQRRSLSELILEQQRKAIQPILERQQRSTYTIMKPYLEEQRRITNQVLKNLLL